MTTTQIPGQRAIDLDVIPGQLEIEEPPAVDWNVCIGYKVAEHAHPAEDLRASYLCPSCDDRLNAEVDASRSTPRPAATRCIGGDHAPGSRYYDCLGCYGD